MKADGGLADQIEKLVAFTEIPAYDWDPDTEELLALLLELRLRREDDQQKEAKP